MPEVEGWEDLYDLDSWFESEAALVDGFHTVRLITDWGKTTVLLDDAAIIREEQI